MKHELLSTEAAAEYLGLSRRTLDQWRADGEKLPYVKFSEKKFARSMYRKSDLDDFIAKNTRQIA